MISVQGCLIPNVETQLLTWCISKRSGDGQARNVLTVQSLVEAMGSRIAECVPCEWIGEAAEIYKNGADPEPFFACKSSLKNFLALRSQMVLSLLKITTSWLPISTDSPHNLICED